MIIKPITRRQSEVLEFIKLFIGKEGYPPTVREIAEHMDYQSSSTAFHLIEQLVRKGYITKGDSPRTIQIVGRVNQNDKDELIEELRRELKQAQEREREFQGMAESIGAYASGAPIIKYQEIENIINSSWLINYGKPGLSEMEGTE